MNRLARKKSGEIFLLALSIFLCARLVDGQVMVWGDNSLGQTNVPASSSNAIALAAGDYHCLALHADGTVAAWGGNYNGQTNVPSGLTNVVGIAAGSASSLALRKDGSVAVWGVIGPNNITNVPPSVTNAVSLALGPGAQHVLALRADGTVVDWGDTNYSLPNIPPTAQNVVSVAAGNFFAVAVRADGTVVTWGNGPSVPASATNAVAVAAGWYDAVALLSDGTVVALGTASLPSPRSTGFTNVVDVACPFNSIFSGSFVVLRRNGTMAEWPFAAPGTTQAIPNNATNIAAIAAGSYDALAAVGRGSPVFPGMPINRTVDAGMNAYFRMNAVGAVPLFYQWSCNGTNLPWATNPVLVLTNVQPSQAGNYYSVTASNTFGTNLSGKMTLSVTPSEVFIQPQTVSTVFDGTVTFAASTIGLGPFTYQWQVNGTNLLAATNATLTLMNVLPANSGTYSVVTSNSFGLMTNFAELVLSPTIITRVPQSQTIFPNGTVTLNMGVQAIIPVAYQWLFNGTAVVGATNSALTLTNIGYGQGGTYSVILSDAYELLTNSATVSVVPVAAWGYMGQSYVPPGLTNLLAVACGEMHALALNSDGTVTGWGTDFVPAPAGLSNVVAIAAGNDDSLALQANGTVTAWGEDSDGDTIVPPGLANVVAVAAGDFHNLALKSDGTIVAWGNNDYGQTNVPAGLTNVVAVAAGEWNSMALKADGTVVAWGAGTTNTGVDPNFGQSMVPAGLSNVIQIATAGVNDLAFRTDGSLTGWGENYYGEDVLPAGISNVVAIADGYDHSVVLKVDGTVAAWGDNELGQTNVPAGLTSVASISAKGFQTVALVGNGPPTQQVAISNLQLTAAGFSLALPSQIGRVYRLEYKNSLSDSNWIAQPLVGGNGGALGLLDGTATNAGQRFYRVRRW
jgi:alpha-tubulin suppressor-like RCC1 family protein